MGKGQQKVEVDKETAISFMQDSFEFCNKAVASMTPERLDTIVGPPPAISRDTNGSGGTSRLPRTIAHRPKSTRSKFYLRT